MSERRSIKFTLTKIFFPTFPKYIFFISHWYFKVKLYNRISLLNIWWCSSWLTGDSFDKIGWFVVRTYWIFPYKTRIFRCWCLSFPWDYSTSRECDVTVFTVTVTLALHSVGVAGLNMLTCGCSPVLPVMPGGSPQPSARPPVATVVWAADIYKHFNSRSTFLSGRTLSSKSTQEHLPLITDHI